MPFSRNNNFSAKYVNSPKQIGRSSLLTASYVRRPSLDHLHTDWAWAKPSPPSDLGSPDPLLAFGTPSHVALVLPLARYRSPRADFAPRNVPLSANTSRSIIFVRIFIPTIK